MPIKYALFENHVTTDPNDRPIADLGLRIADCGMKNRAATVRERRKA
jgi:hypothetical protein